MVLSRYPFGEQIRQRGRSFDNNLDRFIPNRSAIDWDYATTMLTGRKGKENPPLTFSSSSSEAYQKLLAETFNMNKRRILAYGNKPQNFVDPFLDDFLSSTYQSKSTGARRVIPLTPERVLDVPDLPDDYCTNLLDWGCNNVLSICIGQTVYLWDASVGSPSEMATVDDECGPITSVKWAPDGKHIAVGLNNSEVQLWDYTSVTLLRTLNVGHRSRVGALDWKNCHILTCGGMDGQVINVDIRLRPHNVQTYEGHKLDVCGLKWSSSGQQLASGGNDNLLHIWDRRRSSPNQWLHRLEDHNAAVRGLAWSPFKDNLLASGGGENIRFWNTVSGSQVKSVDTGSQVCALLWNKNENELLSSHGSSQQNQLTLWKYPSMVKIAELNYHASRVLFMAQSPDGCTVASAARDENLCLWNVFGAKSKHKKAAEPFARWNCR